MQWVPAKSHEGTSRPDDLCCSVCQRSGTGGVHCCALCYRDNGERHTICSACSRDPSSLQRYAGQQESPSTPQGARTVPCTSELRMSRTMPVQKSSSTGCIPTASFQRRRGTDISVRASEWSLVS